MFIKFGKQENLIKLRDNGEMFFNPCKTFRNWDKDDGVGDGSDGGLIFPILEGRIINRTTNQSYDIKGTSLSNIVDRAKRTPMFCIKRADTPYMDEKEFADYKRNFPDYDSALLIKDEESFLDKISYRFKKTAFCHKVFYQDVCYTDFAEFLFNGESDVDFVSPAKQGRYYAEIKYELLDGTCQDGKIDDSNYYRTMYSKRTKYSPQQEYRIILPYEQIDEGKKYYIRKFDSELVKIDELLKDKH